MMRIYQFPIRRFGNGEIRSYRLKRSQLKSNELNLYLNEADLSGEDDLFGSRSSGSFSGNTEKREWNSDQKIAREIRTAIEDEEFIPAEESDGIDVQVDEGIVTLSGTVSSQEEKKAIAQRVEALVGAEKFVNHLNVASQ